MRTEIGRAASCCLALGLGLLLQASNQSAQINGGASIGRPELQRLYAEYLASEGYRPEVDKDGDVQFMKEGKTYFIQVDEKDLEYFRLVLANFWKIGSAEERSRVLAAANAANIGTKVAKILALGDNVWASVELLVSRPEDFKGIFRRALRVLDSGVGAFKAKMRE